MKIWHYFLKPHRLFMFANLKKFDSILFNDSIRLDSKAAFFGRAITIIILYKN